MTIADIASAVLRRWYVTVLVLVVTGVAATQAWTSAAPVYSSSTMLAVVPSPSFMQVRASTGTGESSLGNPFGFTASATLSALLADAINYGSLELPPEADGTRISVATSNETRGSSYLTVDAVGTSPDAVVAALASLDSGAPALLNSIQITAGAPSDQVFTAFRTRGISSPYEQFPDRQRATLGIVLVGLLMTALLAVAVDSLIKRRRSRTVDSSSVETADEHVERDAETSRDRAEEQGQAPSAPRPGQTISTS